MEAETNNQVDNNESNLQSDNQPSKESMEIDEAQHKTDEAVSTPESNLPSSDAQNAEISQPKEVEIPVTENSGAAVDNNKVTEEATDKDKTQVLEMKGESDMTQATSDVNVEPENLVAGAAAVDESVAAGTLEKTSVYKIKTIKTGDGNVPIITQNENGPCPLIAIVNVLLLKGKKNPFGSKLSVTSEDLMGYLGEIILHNSPQEYASESAQLNYEKNMSDAISIFPKLQTGLDVNVRFTGVKDFEYTPECIIFDLLNIQLYHGWLVDPQAKDVSEAIGKLSYNQLVEKIITNKSSSEPDVVTEALVAESFLERTASQLTHYGLCELNNVMKSNEMAVLFRNNHFSTIYKNKNELFQLVTDQGFLLESNVVWETLSNIDGDGEFVDAAFVTVPPKPAPAKNVPTDPINPEEQIEQDYLVALSLQKEESRGEENDNNWEEYKAKELGITSDVTDEELARRIQEDEQKRAQGESEARRAAAAQNANEPLPKQQSSEPSAGQSSRKKSDCTIL